jgi:hypothetical protein
VETFWEGPFAYSTSLSNIFVHPANRKFASSGGVLFSKDFSLLIQYPAGNFATSYTTSPRTKEIADSAFAGNDYLEGVFLGNSIQTVGDFAFYGSQNLVSVTFGTGVKALGDLAFADIPSLVTATFDGNAPQTIAANVFFGASDDFIVRYTAGKSGFDKTKEPWKSLYNRGALQPIWPESPELSPSSGFRAIGTVAPAPFNGNIGGQISLAVSRSRAVSGTLTMGELPKGLIAVYRFTGILSQEGLMSITIPRRAKSTLTLTLQLDLQNAPGYFKFNSKSQLDDGSDAASVAAAIVPWSPVFPATLYGGQYNIALKTNVADVGEVDPGYGFLSATINPGTGAVRLAGVMADGTRATSSSMLLGLDLDLENPKNSSNTIPLWIPLYRNQGMLWGDLELRLEFEKSISAELLWTKPPDVPRSTNILGFNDVLLGAEKGSGIFNAPAVSSFGNQTLTFDDGINPDITVTFRESKGRIRPDSNTNNMKATWNLRGGLFQGTFMPSPADKRLTRFQGIILYNNETKKFETFGNFQLPNTPPDKEKSFFQGGSVSN